MIYISNKYSNIHKLKRYYHDKLLPHQQLKLNIFKNLNHLSKGKKQCFKHYPIINLPASQFFHHKIMTDNSFSKWILQNDERETTYHEHQQHVIDSNLVRYLQIRERYLVKYLVTSLSELDKRKSKIYSRCLKRK